jgi:hypothetical protein
MSGEAGKRFSEKDRAPTTNRSAPARSSEMDLLPLTNTNDGG